MTDHVLCLRCPYRYLGSRNCSVTCDIEVHEYYRSAVLEGRERGLSTMQVIAERTGR